MIIIIVTNHNGFTKVCFTIEETYKALSEAHDLLSDNHIHIEFYQRNKASNDSSANYEAIIWNKDITRL